MMTEYAIPVDELIDFKGETFISPAIETTEETLPRIDPVRGVFIASNGQEIELSDKPVNYLIIQQIQTNGKPKIPQIEVLLLGKHKQLEYFPGHEGYQARLKEWEAESELAQMRYLFVAGTKGMPPQDFIDEHLGYLPNATENELKYLWVASRLPYEDIGAFAEALISKTITTTKGLNESAESFRSQG